MKQKVVIQTVRPLWRVGISVVVLAIVSASGWALYQWARSDALFDWRSAQEKEAQMTEQRTQLEQQIEELTARSNQLREELVYLERSIDIDRQACSEVKASLGELQQALTDAREQLAFYRGIVSPKQAHAGVRTYDLSLRPAGVPDTYLYDLVLIQSVRHDRKISGAIDVVFMGLQNGLAMELPLADVSLDQNPRMTFAFRYFEEFTGQVRLPSNFRPQRVRVSISVRGSRANAVQNHYDWADLIRG